MNVKFVGCNTLLSFFAMAMVTALVFSDINDTSYAPEIGMFFLGLSCLLELFRDIFTVDRRFGGTFIDNRSTVAISGSNINHDININNVRISFFSFSQNEFANENSSLIRDIPERHRSGQMDYGAGVALN